MANSRMGVLKHAVHKAANRKAGPKARNSTGYNKLPGSRVTGNDILNSKKASASSATPPTGLAGLLGGTPPGQNPGTPPGQGSPMQTPQAQPAPSPIFNSMNTDPLSRTSPVNPMGASGMTPQPYGK